MTAPKHDWYLRDWLKVLKKRQTDIVADLEWNKAKVSLMLSGKQQYTRDAVNELAEYLNLHPFELLMHPADAMRLRSLRENAIQVVANTAPLAAANDDRTGTNG